MSLFELYKDVKYASWDRLYYNVEADSIEDAIEKINKGLVDEYDVVGLDIYETITPEENGGFSTVEILNEDYDVIYKNGE